MASETIVVTWADGSITTYTDCTGITDDGKQIKFNGKKAGDGALKDHALTITQMRGYSRETT